MTVMEAASSRRTIRKFKRINVEREKLLKLVNAARLAPTAQNMQPLKFKIVGALEAARVFPHVKWASAISPRGNPNPGEEPAAYILIMSDSSIKRGNCDMDAGIAAQTIALCAVDLGLGTCLMGAIDRKAICRELAVPKGLRLELAVAVGYPAQEPVAVDMKDGYKYWLNENGVLNVPKRSLEEILV